MTWFLRRATGVGVAAILLGLLTACSGGSSATPGTSAPQPSAVVPQETGGGTFTPTFTELPIDASALTGGPTVPWSLVRVDRELNRIYLSASSSGCVTPTAVRIEETSTSLTLTVVGVGGTEPCTLERTTMLGYVTPTSPLGNRTILGSSSTR